MAIVTSILFFLSASALIFPFVERRRCLCDREREEGGRVYRGREL